MTDLTYADYLQVNTLLSLQQPRTSGTADRAVVLAEHFFIVAHQSCELWLKQLIADLDAVVDTLASGSGSGSDAADLELGAELLRRAGDLLRVLHEQVLVLERLPLRHFVEFRPFLGTASGAQSEQFAGLGRLVGTDRRAGALYEAFTAAAERSGLSVAQVCRLGPEAGGLHRVAEALLDVGDGLWRWKVAHLGLMSRMVGGEQGTGGTSGIDYLIRRIVLPFPELRSHRGQVHAAEFAGSTG
ncbi:tryptophan 2,3-dioxygenase family protein [Kitasatospora sp. NPDC052868]|uniref:tryptophan 2,3-dioxygenase family protein n=1 Tax=Kitasatospora sp. NPDC052868 TaxID=3364060 RepID=UPI0037CA3CA3